MQTIENNSVLKEILADSFGGIMYNEANKDKYDTEELLKEWKQLSASERESLGGIVNGAMNFISNK